jgi:acyl transferase domain-containing protein
MSASETPIAIVGMSCLFPQAPDLSSYWRNIVAARVSTGPVPDDHSWTPDEHWDADPKAPDKTYSRAGGFLEKVPFDPLQHGLTPSALDATDTTQLLSLIVAREALKDAGIDPDATNWPRHRTSCILGVTGTQELAITLGARLQGPAWKKAMLRCGIDATVADDVVADIGKHFPEWQEQSFPGLLGNVVSGRIANRLDLGGTNCVTDAACASSLAAVRMALDDLAQGRCDLALSGGADTLNDIFMYMCFSKTPALSKAGQARPFDADADGTLISEGIAILALKREADARRDGDRIYAVIKGLGASSDGRGQVRSTRPEQLDGQKEAPAARLRRRRHDARDHRADRGSRHRHEGRVTPRKSSRSGEVFRAARPEGTSGRARFGEVADRPHQGRCGRSPA